MTEDIETDADEKDPFILNSIFPDADQVFGFTLKTVESIRDDCDVVLDTNVLLIPYTTSPKSIEQIKTTYKMLVDQKRLIIPGQVAREFAKHRASKIAELFQQLSTNRDSIPSLKKSVYPLLQLLEDFQEHVKLEATINQLLGEYRSSITTMLQLIRNWTWNDPVSELYRQLFSKDVVKDLVIDQEELKKEMIRRRTHKIPPGYKDKGAGDLIIWKTILEQGSNNKDIIFVSNDVKTDWWYQSDRESLYPRYELVDEYRRETNGRSLHILTFSKFLDLYGASDTVVEEVRIEERLARIDTIRTRTRAQEVHKAVWKWLVSNYRDCAILKYYKDFPDFVISKPDNSKIDVEIRSVRQAWEVERRFREIKNRIEGEPDLFFSGYLIVFVGLDLSSAMLIHARLNKLKSSIINGSLIVGFINPDGEFESLQ